MRVGKRIAALSGRWAFICGALVMLFAIAACGAGASQVAKTDRSRTNTQVDQLHQSQPPPKLTHSLELDNIYERLTRFNVPSKISYIYLFSNSGVLMDFSTVKGKVSHVDSLPTSPNTLECNQSPDGCSTTDQPQLDGSYGTNGNSIFWFTAEDEYREWNGIYLLKDKPSTLTSQPVLKP